MSSLNTLEQVSVTTLTELAAWLSNNYRQSASVWLVTYKKHVESKYIAYSDIVDELLCYGWIDSLPRKLDKDRSMILISPRKSSSAWSAVNKKKIATLRKEKRLTPHAEKQIADAKKSGMWSFLDDVDALIIPEDLMAELQSFKCAQQNFENFPPSAKRGILEWIKWAKKPETRARRVRKTAELAEQNIRANH